MDEIMFMGENDHHHPHMDMVNLDMVNFKYWKIQTLQCHPSFIVHVICYIKYHAHGDISLMSFIHIIFAIPSMLVGPCEITNQSIHITKLRLYSMFNCNHIVKFHLLLRIQFHPHCQTPTLLPIQFHP